MRRRQFLCLIPAAAIAQNGQRDRYFARYPFDKWSEAGDRAQLRWNVRIPAPQLTSHQRLASRVEVEIEAREVEKRRGRGELITFFQIEDSGGRRWRRHDTFNLAAVPAGAKAKAAFYAQDFFVLPGDYKVSLAVCDSKTSGYSFTQRTLRVSPLRNDPLPNAFATLPAIELASPLGLPDYWFQPYTRGRLNLPIETAKTVQIDVILNLTLSERTAGSLAAFRRNMNALVPALKVLSQLRPSQGVLNVTLLDLTKRRIWEQKNVEELNWERLRAPFAESNPGVIDAQSLAAKEQMTQFFWDQILDRLRPDPGGAEHRAVIVLSSPLFLAHQIKVEPAAPPRDPRRRVFYLRYRPLPRYRTIPIPDGGILPPAAALPSDDLEKTLKGLDAKNFSPINPAEFRKALAAIMETIRAWVE